MAASGSSTYTINTEGKQDGHVRVNCIGNFLNQPADQLKKKECGVMAYQPDIHSRAMSIAGMTALWSRSCPTAVDSFP